MSARLAERCDQNDVRSDSVVFSLTHFDMKCEVDQQSSLRLQAPQHGKVHPHGEGSFAMFNAATSEKSNFPFLFVATVSSPCVAPRSNSFPCSPRDKSQSVLSVFSPRPFALQRCSVFSPLANVLCLPDLTHVRFFQLSVRKSSSKKKNLSFLVEWHKQQSDTDDGRNPN
jgi:hypothetical protein